MCSSCSEFKSLRFFIASLRQRILKTEPKNIARIIYLPDIIKVEKDGFIWYNSFCCETTLNKAIYGNRLSGGCFCVSVGYKDLGEYEYAEDLCYDKYRLWISACGQKLLLHRRYRRGGFFWRPWVRGIIHREARAWKNLTVGYLWKVIFCKNNCYTIYIIA